MKTVDLTPKKQKEEVSTRKIRCVSSPRSTFNRKLPSIALAGVWLQKAGFEVGVSGNQLCLFPFSGNFSQRTTNIPSITRISAKSPSVRRVITDG